MVSTTIFRWLLKNIPWFMISEHLSVWNFFLWLFSVDNDNKFRPCVQTESFVSLASTSIPSNIPTENPTLFCYIHASLLSSGYLLLSYFLFEAQSSLNHSVWIDKPIFCHLCNCNPTITKWRLKMWDFSSGGY